MPSTSSFHSLDPTVASTSSKRQRPVRPTGPVVYKNLKSLEQTYRHKEFVRLMKGNPSALKIWHNHKTYIKNPAIDLQEVFYAVSTSKDEDFNELLGKVCPSFESVREMYIPAEDFCGLDVLEPGFVFDAVEGHKRIITHCLPHISKGKALRENGLGTSTALEVFVPLFQPLLTQKGRCSSVVKGDDALYLEYIGLLADIVTEGSPISRYYFLGFKARRLQSNFVVKTVIRANKTPKRDKKSKKFDDALTEQEEVQVYNLVCEKLAIELSKTGKGRDIDKCRQEVGRRFTDDTKLSRRSDVYVKYVKNYLSTHRVYSESTIIL